MAGVGGDGVVLAEIHVLDEVIPGVGARAALCRRIAAARDELVVIAFSRSPQLWAWAPTCRSSVKAFA